MSSTAAQPIVTADNFGPIVNVITWFLGSTAVLFVIARLATKLVLAQSIRIDDGLLVTSLIFSIGLVVAVSLETIHGGLGRHKSSLSQSDLTTYQKVSKPKPSRWSAQLMTVQAAYAGDLLYILSLTFSKISVLLLLRLITPVRLQIQFISALGATLLLWGLTALLAAAFQCQVPRVWGILSNGCFQMVFSRPKFFDMIHILIFTQVSFWNYFEVTNMITEGILVVLPIIIFWNLQMPWVRKMVIVWCFAVRIL